MHLSGRQLTRVAQVDLPEFLAHLCWAETRMLAQLAELGHADRAVAIRVELGDERRVGLTRREPLGPHLRG